MEKARARSAAGRAKGKNRPASAQTEPPPQSHPVAGPARLRRRHYGLLASFVLLVILPLFAVVGYLYHFAQDRYVSTTGFTVRAEETGAATDLLGGLAQFAGGSGQADGDILFEFVTSQPLVQRLDDRLDLVAHYAAPFSDDPVFALRPDATMEDLVDYWQRVVRVSYNSGNGLVDLRVLAFDPATANALASAILEESTDLINRLNAQARADSMRFAEADLRAAIDRLRTAREALTSFRTSTQIVDPESDLQGRMGVLNTLQQQLAEALIEFDLLSETTTNPDDVRLMQAENRIDVIRDRIAQERLTFTAESVGPDGDDYPTLMARFEGLVVDREYAEESYRAALTALDLARANAARQSRYLAVFIPPSLPESAEHPQRELLSAMAALFLILGWAILALVYYSIRDRQ